VSRVFGWLLVVQLVAALGALSLPAASADPDSRADTNDNPGSCQYALTAPQRTEVPGGAAGVTATLTPGACTGQPVITTVCLTRPGGQSECAKTYAFDTATITIVAAPAQGTFSATGKGCWQPRLNADFVCETPAPMTATLKPAA
jgi:hypothetical protein